MKTIDNGKISEGVRGFEDHFRFVFPPTCCYFADVKPQNVLSPEPDVWTCMFSFIGRISGGGTLCLADDNSGCSGAACYLGFRKPGGRAGIFLADKEGFKKSADFGRAFYEEIRALPAPHKYFVMEKTDGLSENTVPDVITLWVSSDALPGLVTLANYDRHSNDNVIIPFASGCQSIWTIPFKEKDKGLPKCVVGMMDPAATVHLPSEALSFSMPVKRFIEMADNIPGSFLEK